MTRAIPLSKTYCFIDVKQFTNCKTGIRIPKAVFFWVFFFVVFFLGGGGGVICCGLVFAFSRNGMFSKVQLFSYSISL